MENKDAINKEEKTEEINETIKLEQQLEKKENELKKKRKKRKTRRIISDIIFGILALIIVLEAVVGIVNMKKLSDGEEPVWYLSATKEETENKTVEEYNLGLYKIVKTDTKKDSRIVLKPFFLK